MEYTIKIPRELLSNQNTLSHPCDVVGIKDPPPKDGDDDDGLVDGDINGGGDYRMVKSTSSQKTEDGENNNNNNNENNSNHKEENKKNSDKNYKEKSMLKNNLVFNNNKIRLVVKGLNNEVRLKVGQPSLGDKKEFIDEGGGERYDKKNKILTNNYNRVKNNSKLPLKNYENFNTKINTTNNTTNLSTYTATPSDNIVTKIRLKRRSIIEDDDQHHKRFRPVYSIMPYKQDPPDASVAPAVDVGVAVVSSVGNNGGSVCSSVVGSAVTSPSSFTFPLSSPIVTSSSVSILSTSSLDTTTDYLNNLTSTSIAYTSLGTTSTPHPPKNSTPYHSTPKSAITTPTTTSSIPTFHPCDRLSISAILSKTTPTQTGVNTCNNLHQKSMQRINGESPLKQKSSSFSSLKMITNNLTHILKDNKKVVQQKRSINQPIKSNERNIFDLVKPMLTTDLGTNKVITTTTATLTSKKYNTTTTTTTTPASGKITSDYVCNIEAQSKDADINNNNMQQPDNYHLNNTLNNINNISHVSNFNNNDISSSNHIEPNNNPTPTDNKTTESNKATTLSKYDDETQIEAKFNHDESLIDVETYDDDDDDSGVCFAAHSLTETTAYNNSHNDSGVAKEVTIKTTSITTTASTTFSTATSLYSKTTNTTSIQIPQTTTLLSLFNLNTKLTTAVAFRNTTVPISTTTHSSTTPLNIPQYSHKPLQVVPCKITQRKNNSIDNITTNLLNSVANKINNSLNNLNNKKIISFNNLNNNKNISLNNLNNNKVISLNNLNKFNYSEPLNLIKIDKSATSTSFTTTTTTATTNEVAKTFSASSTTTSTVTISITPITTSHGLNIINTATTTTCTATHPPNSSCYHNTGIFLNKIASDFRHFPQNLSHKAIQDRNAKSNTKIIRIDDLPIKNMTTAQTADNNADSPMTTKIIKLNPNANDTDSNNINNDGAKEMLMDDCNLTCSVDTDHHIKLKLIRKHNDKECKSNSSIHEKVLDDVAVLKNNDGLDVVKAVDKDFMPGGEDDKNTISSNNLNSDKDINNNYVPNLNNKESETITTSTPALFFSSSSSPLFIPSSSLNSRSYKISKREMSGLYMDMSQKYLQEFPSNGFAFDSTLNHLHRGAKRPRKNKADVM